MKNVIYTNIIIFILLIVISFFGIENFKKNLFDNNIKNIENVKKEKRINKYMQINTQKEKFLLLQKKIRIRKQKKDQLINDFFYSKQKNKKKIKNVKSTKYEKKLTVTYIDFKNKNVIINSKILCIGDSINIYKVLKIYKNKVLLYSEKGFKWLKLFK